MKVKKHLYIGFLLFTIGLIVVTYVGRGEEYIVFLAAVLRVSKLARGKRTMNIGRNKLPWIVLVSWIIAVSTIGIITSQVIFKTFIECIIKFVCLPYVVYCLCPMKKDDSRTMLFAVKDFIFVSAVYGLVESVLKYNYLERVVRIESVSWITTMNSRSVNYQPSSLFLHYTYYGCVLLVGFVIGYVFPYRRKWMNILYTAVLVEQLIISQSRMSWVALIVLVLCEIVKTKRISNKHFRRGIVCSLMFLFVVIINPEPFIRIVNFVDGRFSVLWKYGFDDGSLGQRFGTLMNWPKYFNANPIKGIFGTGFQSVSNDFLRDYSYFSGYNTADCEYTIILVDIGIIGMILFIYAIVYFFSKSLKKVTDDGIRNVARLGMISLLIEFITIDVVSNNLIFSLMLMYIALALKMTINSNVMFQKARPF